MWKSDDVGYHGAHKRVAKHWGLAAQYGCVDCGQPASQWSYDHKDPDEKYSKLGFYSLDPRHYKPRCVKDHKIYDLENGRARALMQGLID